MDRQERFSIRKLTVGVASVAIGFWLAGSDNIAHADTVDGNVNQSQVKTDSANTDALAESKTNTSDSSVVKPNTTPVETKKNETGSAVATAPKTNVASTGANANTANVAETKLDNVNSVVANSNNALAQAKSVKAESVVQPKVRGTSTETKPNELGSNAANPNTVSTESKLNIADLASLAKIKPQKIRLAKLANSKALAESKVATDNQFNFDDWTTQIDNNYLNITGYKGDRSKQIVVPNGADFAKAGKNDKNLQVEIYKNTLKGLIVDGVAPKLSDTDGQKIVAKGNDWSWAFHNKNLHDISGLANLDTSNVTNMSNMFEHNQISDLSPLANWNTGNVTDMSSMFYINQISDLSPLSNWNTSNVTDMRSMFERNQISNLIPLSNWNIGNVTDMSSMFERNQINDLSPLSNWNTDKITDMNAMFTYNQISDLSSLSNWNTGNIIRMDNMFLGNQISDLSPLANWNTGKVTNMSYMFHNNQISDLSPLADWDTGKVDFMGDMFSDNQISDLSLLANWNTGNVTHMESMFEDNQISDLNPLVNWNISNVTDMDKMFNNDPLDVTINNQSTLNKFHAAAYKLDNTGALTSHSESKTFNDGSQILLDKDVVTNRNSATLTFKANSSTGNTYQIKIYNPNQSIDIQAAALPTALGTTDTSYQDGYTIITNKFINNGSVSQDISITPKRKYFDIPAFAQYESTSGLITVAKDNENLGSINITYQNTSDISNRISAPYIGDKPYINHTQNTFYFQPRIITDSYSDQYSFIKSAGLTITVPDDVAINPDTFIDTKTGKTLKGTKIADNQYQVVLDNTRDEIAVKGLINVPADKLTNGTSHLSGFGMKYTVHTYNDKVAPLVATGTSKELSVIPDLASYHGDLININQSKWAFDRNGNEVYAYRSQGFTNTFNGVPLEPAVSTQVTNGIETFDMPIGVNITNFNPNFNSDPIDHIDYIYTDGSKQTDSDFNTTPKAIRQMKVYFKKGIQSDKLSGYSYSFRLSFDTTYPDGTPIKNFDTFKIIGSFSCDELGSTDNVDVAQIMLVPKQKLTDGMVTGTDQDESNKVSNASGNFINARILNDNVLQHQGHLTNPIFYFKYNDLMVPDLSKISASYDNQNKGLGSIGLTNIDNNKIHSSIITDSTGQKFVKVQIDGEYYYVSSFDSSNPKSGFNVKIAISNTPDALSATKDWSWYILNSNDEAKTESAIQNSSQGNKPLPVTVDGNTLSVGGVGTWQIITAQGFTSSTETQGNLNGGPGLASTQDDHQQDPTHFTIYDSIINATNDAKSDLVSVANLPSTQDGKSQFDVHMTGKASLINVMTGQTYDATITYSYGTGDNNFITSDQVTDWSKVKSIKVLPNGGAPSLTSLRLVVPVEDNTIYDDVGKTIYMSTMTYGEDKTNTNYTTKDGFAVPEKSTILPIIIKPGDAASAKLTVRGQATVHTLIQYNDKNGKDVYVKLADKDKTYNELQDTMRRSDYFQSDRDLTIADRGLLPTGMVINYNNPTIRNSNNTYAAGYANGAASFGETAKYDFDGDQVIFEGAMPEVITKTHQVKETIHYVYRDGSTAKPDKVLTSITLKQTGYKNPFTGEITWDSSATDTLSSVDSPEILGYIADKSVVPSYVVTVNSPDKEVTVTYDADNETADFTYFDDTTNSTLKVVNKSGKSNTSIGYTTADEINNYEQQGYILVSDDTDGRSLNFDSLPTVDQHYMIHLKHKTERITRNGTVTRTIHYRYDNGNTAKPDKTQTVSFNETGTKDDVTGKTTWDNDNSQTVDKVITPSITGYTSDKQFVDKQTFNFGAKDVEVTVTYTANTQTATITYIDDTTNTNLSSKDASGKFGQTIIFATAPIAEIANYEKQGYVLVSNDFDTRMYQTDNSKNVFHVHLKHGTVTVTNMNPQTPDTPINPKDPQSPKYPKDINNITKDVKRTIDYKFKDDKTAQPTVNDSLHFERTVVIDKVTGKVSSDTWTPSQNFNDIQTPAIQGYTPNKAVVSDKNIGHDHNDIVEHVVYSPDAQHMTITYIDDTTGKTLHTDTPNDGVSDQDANYTTSDAIKKYEGQHYKLVSDSTKGQDLIFDHDDNVDQSYEVHFVHDTHSIDDQTTKSEVIHYVYADGLARQGKVTDDNVQQLSFKRDGYNDEVTNEDHWNAWTPDTQEFASVKSPEIQGYTADLNNVPTIKVNADSDNIERTVTYKANKQTLDVAFIDDTTGKTLLTVTKDGVSDERVNYNTANDLDHYKSLHFNVISDGTQGQNLVFDHDDSKDQHYEVHLVHATHSIDDQTTKSEAIHYVYQNGSKAADDYHASDLVFTRDGYHDEVTNEDHWNAWTPAQQEFSSVKSPEIQGYTADQVEIPAIEMNADSDNIKRTVTYKADIQNLDVAFIDDTTGQTLKMIKKSGPSDTSADYNTKNDIDGYKAQHYNVVSDSTNGHDLVFDHTDNVDQHYEVHLSHATHSINEAHDVSQVIHYVYQNGSKAGDDHTNHVHFARDGYCDEVTSEDHWNKWTPSATYDFAVVHSPKIQGFTPDIQTVDQISVTPSSQNVEQTVTYYGDVQLGHVKYIDDSDNGRVMSSDDLSGHTGETDSYTTTKNIKIYTAQGYIFVSDNYPAKGVVFDNNDLVDQYFEVHFKHGTTTVTPKQPGKPGEPINSGDPNGSKYPNGTDAQSLQTDVPRTISYVYQNGKQAQSSVNDLLHFTETKVIDKVTGKVLSDTWSPAQSFETKITPTIDGYTPDRQAVSNTGINHDHPAIHEVVTYNPDAQKAVVKYIDDTDQKQLSSKDLTGHSDQDSSYNTKSSINKYLADHYVLVSDDTHGQNVIYDHNDKADQVYEVHFKHGTEPASERRTKNLTVHYVYADGLARSGKASEDQKAQSLTFKRTGTKDLVTNNIAWNAWDHDDQAFDEIKSPTIDGYTPDQTAITDVQVNADGLELTEKTVVYNADSQKLMVNFIDDTTGKTLETINKVGQSDESANYNTKSDISKYLAQHYDLVSDDTNSNNLVFDHDDNTDQVYNVHLRHATHQINDQTIKSEVIHYVYADGLARTGQAVDDYHASDLAFTRDGYHDEVTNEDHWNAWTPAQQEFASVKSPEIDGYTADQTEVPVIKVNADSDNIERTVTYNADKQKLDVVFIDDTLDKTLSTVTKEGLSDENVNYNTKDDINHYKSLHYNVVSDATQGQNLVFDHDDSKDQHYEIHLVHATHPIDEQTSTKQTIHYQLADGTKVFDDYTAEIDFSRDGYNDEVTNEDHWNKWSPSDIQTFSNVVSPVKSGYTPDQASVAVVDVHPGDKDIDETVIYSPDTQVMTINYIDDVTGKTLSTKQIIGVSDASVNYNTKSSINSYVADHYKLVSDDTNGDNLVFDHDDSINQVYNVHLTHTYQNVDEHKSVNETVHYIYDNGQTARPDYKAPAINFSRTGTQDLVTNDIVWNAWTPDEQSFDQVTTPAISGYTPDVEVVPSVNVSHGSDDVERTVIYHADDQTILVNYIDDDIHSTLKTDTVIGKTAQKSNYTTKKSIDGYIVDHYELVSDDTNNNELVFDSDSTKAQVYNVHLKHAHQNVSDSALVHETIHYIYADGSKARDDYTAPAISFKRTGDQDLVTNTIVWNAWSPASQDFKTVESPVIDGYTPSQKTISNITVKPGDKDIDQTVVYVPDNQSIVVNYIDDVAGKTLKTDTLTGKSDLVSDYTTKNNINGYENQHYVLVSDETQGKTLTFDHDDKVTQVYNVHLSHQTEPASQSRTVHETINYVYADGSKAADTVTAKPLTFTQTGVKDLVTGNIDWNGTWTSKQTFAEVKSPEIQGYTADQTEIPAIEINADSDNIERIVTYKADKQKLNVAFIDDTTGKTLLTVTKDGASDEKVNYNTANDLDHYKSLHYNVVSDGTQGQNLVFDHDDSKDQYYEVHLVHATHPISESTSTKQTSHYQLADGTKVFDDHISALTFMRDGYNDEVTNEDHWNKWQPNETQDFAAVKSPIKPGYTPDHAVIDEMTIKPHAEDIDKTVIYSPDKQVMTINYIDDVTGKTLSTNQIIGVSDAGSNYNTKSSINSYIADHYKLVSDDTNSDNLVFDHDDSTDQIYNVHLTHMYQKVDDHKSINETIHYIYDNGQTAKPDHHADPVIFERVGDKDCVTNEIKWDNWTSKTNRFISVVTPAINGYTPDIERVSSVVVDPESKDIEQTVVYKADDQTILINYIDDDTNRTIKTDTVIGKTAQNSDYNTKDSISTYSSNHYLLVSDDTHGEKLVFDSDSTKPQIYNVHLKHEHQKVSDSKIVHETIHYVYTDGRQAAPEYHADAIKFDRIGDQDCVTKNIAWQNWSPENAEFTSVKSPIVLGYTPNRSYVDQIAVTPDSEDIDETVTYNPDAQYILINYIDDITGKTLKTDTLTGKSDRASDYTTKNNINGYENQHYVLVSDDTHGKNTLTFDHDDRSDQIYNVHLTHATTDVKRTRKVNETIDYVYADGSKAADTAVAKPLIFTQTGVKDLVNDKIDWNGQWTDKQSFATVDSPEITGYTPSQKTINAISVSHDSNDINQIVIYTANTQKAVITYVDDTDGDIVACDKTAGRFGEMIKFDHNVDDRIKAFENQGYRLVSNNFDNQTYMANNEQNVFVVHLTHGKTNVQRDDIVTETIEYQFEDGQKAHDSMIQQIKFVQNGIEDSVTKSVVWTPSDPQQFESVTTPHIDGYTPNISQISAKAITFGDSDLNYVVKYIANMQNAKILYIDDNTGTLLKSGHTIGKFNTIIDFNIDPITQISEYINRGYRLVSNNFNNQAYKTDNEQNRFTVHLAHNTQNVQRSKTLMRVIKYQYTNGQKASDDVVQTAEFTQQGVKDLVNDEIKWSQTSDHQFARVITPQIVGYYPDKTSIDTETISYDGHNQTIIVTYTAQELPAQLRIIDDTTGHVLAIDDASGKYHELIEFNDLQKQLQDLQKHGYQITSNTFNNQHYNVDKSQNLFEIHVIKHEDIKHEDIKHEDIKHDDIKHDDIKHEDIKHEDIKHDNIKHDDIKHDDIKHEDIKHEDIKHEDIKHEDIKHDDIKHEDIKHDDIKHEDIKHDDSLIIRKAHKYEKTLPQTGAEDTRTSSVIGAISSLIAGLGLVGVSRKKHKKND